MAVNEAACQAVPWGKSCGKGEWCCLDSSDPNAPKSTCAPCETSWWSRGHCTDRPNESCAKHGFKSWNSLADVEDAAYAAGSAVAKEALKELLCKYTGKCDL